MIKIVTRCTHCKSKFSVDSEVIGTQKKCPKCSKAFRVDEYAEPPIVYKPKSNTSSDNLSPPVQTPSYKETGVIGGVKKQPNSSLSPRQRTTMASAAMVPSYWALKIVIIIVTVVGFIAIIAGIIPIVTVWFQRMDSSSEIKKLKKNVERCEEERYMAEETQLRLEKELKQKQVKLNAARKQCGNQFHLKAQTEYDETDEKLNEAIQKAVEAKMEYEQAKMKLTMTEGAQDTGGAIVSFSSIMVILVGVFIVAFGQLLACVRDIARNSWNWA